MNLPRERRSQEVQRKEIGNEFGSKHNDEAFTFTSHPLVSSVGQNPQEASVSVSPSRSSSPSRIPRVIARISELKPTAEYLGISNATHETRNDTEKSTKEMMLNYDEVIATDLNRVDAVKLRSASTAPSGTTNHISPVYPKGKRSATIAAYTRKCNEGLDDRPKPKQLKIYNSNSTSSPFNAEASTTRPKNIVYPIISNIIPKNEGMLQFDGKSISHIENFLLIENQDLRANLSASVLKVKELFAALDVLQIRVEKSDKLIELAEREQRALLDENCSLRIKSSSFSSDQLLLYEMTIMDNERQKDSLKSIIATRDAECLQLSKKGDEMQLMNAKLSQIPRNLDKEGVLQSFCNSCLGNDSIVESMSNELKASQIKISKLKQNLENETGSLKLRRLSDAKIIEGLRSENEYLLSKIEAVVITAENELQEAMLKVENSECSKCSRIESQKPADFTAYPVTMTSHDSSVNDPTVEDLFLFNQAKKVDLQIIEDLQLEIVGKSKKNEKLRIESEQVKKAFNETISAEKQKYEEVLIEKKCLIEDLSELKLKIKVLKEKNMLYSQDLFLLKHELALSNAETAKLSKNLQSSCTNLLDASLLSSSKDSYNQFQGPQIIDKANRKEEGKESDTVEHDSFKILEDFVNRHLVSDMQKRCPNCQIVEDLYSNLKTKYAKVKGDLIASKESWLSRTKEVLASRAEPKRLLLEEKEPEKKVELTYTNYISLDGIELSFWSLATDAYHLTRSRNGEEKILISRFDFHYMHLGYLFSVLVVFVMYIVS